MLPRAGGLFDQPYGYIQRMIRVMQATNTADEIRRKKEQHVSKTKDPNWLSEHQNSA